MTASLLRDPLMPRDLDHDGMVCWYALGAIARTNDDLGGDSHLLVTADLVSEWDDDEWAELADDTPKLTCPITAGQRARIIATLWDLERQDLGQLDAWWQR